MNTQKTYTDKIKTKDVSLYDPLNKLELFNKYQKHTKGILLVILFVIFILGYTFYKMWGGS